MIQFFLIQMQGGVGKDDDKRGRGGRGIDDISKEGAEKGLDAG